MLRSTPRQYGSVAVTLHWLAAIFIIFAFLMGALADNAVASATKTVLLRLHIAAALIVLLLTALRIFWWSFFDRKPQPLQDAHEWQTRLANLVHLTFYIVILGMIASGIGTMVLSGAGPALIHGDALPNFHDYPPRTPHGLGAKLLIALFIAHVGAVVFHQFIRRDGLLGRMWLPRTLDN